MQKPLNLINLNYSWIWKPTKIHFLLPNTTFVQKPKTKNIIMNATEKTREKTSLVAMGTANHDSL